MNSDSQCGSRLITLTFWAGGILATLGALCTAYGLGMWEPEVKSLNLYMQVEGCPSTTPKASAMSRQAWVDAEMSVFENGHLVRIQISPGILGTLQSCATLKLKSSYALERVSTAWQAENEAPVFSRSRSLKESTVGSWIELDIQSTPPVQLQDPRDPAKTGIVLPRRFFAGEIILKSNEPPRFTSPSDRAVRFHFLSAETMEEGTLALAFQGYTSITMTDSSEILSAWNSQRRIDVQHAVGRPLLNTPAIVRLSNDYEFGGIPFGSTNVNHTLRIPRMTPDGFASSPDWAILPIPELVNELEVRYRTKQNDRSIQSLLLLGGTLFGAGISALLEAFLARSVLMTNSFPNKAPNHSSRAVGAPKQRRFKRSSRGR